MTTSSQTEGVVSALFLDTSRWGSDHILRGRGGPPTSICSVTAHTSLSQGNWKGARPSGLHPTVMPCLSPGSPTDVDVGGPSGKLVD